MTPRSLFIAESDEHLQDVLRDRLKDQGYRVLLAGDPRRALHQFRQHPFEGLIVDARTTGEEGFRVFTRIVEEAKRRQLKCAAIVLLDEDKTAWMERLPNASHVGVLTQHITYKTVSRKLKELMEAAHGPMVLAPPLSEDLPETPADPSLEDLAEEEDEPAPPRLDSRKPTIDPGPMQKAIREAMAAPVPSVDSNWWEKETGPSSRTKETDQKGGAWNILSRLTPTQKTLAALVLGVFVLGLVSAWLIYDRYSKSAFNKVESGMTEAEVDRLFGEAGEEGEILKHLNAVEVEVTIKKKLWRRGSKLLEITFQNGKVTEKRKLNK